MNVHYRIEVYGKVQGVYFRASAREKAIGLGLNGWVANRPDGSVYAEVEGPQPAVEAFIAWCQSGPPQAVVHRVQTQEGEWIGFPEFTIKR